MSPEIDILTKEIEDMLYKSKKTNINKYDDNNTINDY